MAELVDLKGNALVEAPEQNQVLATLKDLIGRIESGYAEVTDVYVLYQTTATDPSLTNRLSLDSGLTCAEAVLWLECEKARVLHGLMGNDYG